jgi:DNA-binding response OmpR family regulator
MLQNCVNFRLERAARKANSHGLAHHILFVDDDVPIRETLALYFKMKGIAVTTAETSREALELAKKVPFDLVILDLDLGGENGMQLLQTFRATYPQRPVIMFTSLGFDAEVVKEARTKGAAACLSKTESLDNLVLAVQRALQ